MRKNRLLISFVAIALGMWFAEFHRVNAQQPQTQTAPLFSANAKYVNGVAPGYWVTAGSGLTLNVSPGTVFCSGAIATYAGGTLSATASVTNYVYLNTASSCVPAIKTSTFTSSDIPIAVVVAGTSTITSIADDRTMFFAGGGGSFTAAGDLSGSSSSQTVVGFDGKALDSGMSSPADQNIPVFNSSDSKWHASSVATVSLPTWLSRSVDAPPSSPTAYDDECNATSFNGTGQWTAINLSTVAVTEANGACNFVSDGMSNNTIRGYWESLPSGNWTFVMKLSTSCDVTNGRDGLFLMESSSGKVFSIDLLGNGTPGIPHMMFSNWASSTSITANQVQLNDSLANVWLAVSYNGTKISMYYSNSGQYDKSTGALTGFQLGFAPNATTFFTTAPDRIGMETNQDWASGGAQPCTMSVDYVRRVF